MTERTTTEALAQRPRLLGGIVGQLGVTGLSVAQQILFVPLFVKMWDADQYASWLILFSLSALIAIADFGLGNGLITALSEAFAHQRRDVAQRIVANAFWLLPMSESLQLCLRQQLFHDLGMFDTR